MTDFSTIVEQVLEDDVASTKEDLMQKISNAKSYFHVLELLNNSKHVSLKKDERIALMKFVNNRLKELQVKGIQIAGDSDPYKKHFIK